MILDWVSAVAAGAINLIPVIPYEYTFALSRFELAADRLGDYASMLGPIVPWNTVQVGFSWIVALIIFWLALVPIKIAFWAVGRE